MEQMKYDYCQKDKRRQLSLEAQMFFRPKVQVKREALKAAQNAVRSHTEKAWDDLRNWTSFVLTDALD